MVVPNRLLLTSSAVRDGLGVKRRKILVCDRLNYRRRIAGCVSGIFVKQLVDPAKSVTNGKRFVVRCEDLAVVAAVELQSLAAKDDANIGVGEFAGLVRREQQP